MLQSFDSLSVDDILAFVRNGQEETLQLVQNGFKARSLCARRQEKPSCCALRFRELGWRLDNLGC